MSSLLHPRFNHLGSSKKRRKKKPKAQIAAEAEHRKFLLSQGIDPDRKRRSLRGAVELDNAASLDNLSRPNISKTSDKICV